MIQLRPASNRIAYTVYGCLEEFGDPMSPYPTFDESYPLASGLRRREAITLALYLYLKYGERTWNDERYTFWIVKHKGPAPKRKEMYALHPQSILASHVREGLGLSAQKVKRG